MTTGGTVDGTPAELRLGKDARQDDSDLITAALNDIDGALEPLIRMLVREARAEERERITGPLRDEIQRLRMALQVCEHTLHLQNPSMEDLHAASYASGAYVAGSWQPEYVEDDLPGFQYNDEPRDPPLDGAP